MMITMEGMGMGMEAMGMEAMGMEAMGTEAMVMAIAAEWRWVPDV